MRTSKNKTQFEHLQRCKKQQRKNEKTKQQQIKMYLDYFNNFLTLKGFADHYNISESSAKKILIAGKYHFNADQ